MPQICSHSCPVQASFGCTFKFCGESAALGQHFLFPSRMHIAWRDPREGLGGCFSEANQVQCIPWEVLMVRFPSLSPSWRMGKGDVWAKLQYGSFVNRLGLGVLYVKAFTSSAAEKTRRCALKCFPWLPAAPKFNCVCPCSTMRLPGHSLAGSYTVFFVRTLQ